MKRQDRYPDTKWFSFYNANAKNKFGADCVVRALCTGLKQGWEETIRELTEVGIEKGYVLNDTHAYKEYLKRKGYLMKKQPRKYDNTKYTGKEFCELCKRKKWKRVIAHIGGHHIVAVVDYKILDIWDSTNGCIGNFWVIRYDA